MFLIWSPAPVCNNLIEILICGLKLITYNIWVPLVIMLNTVFGFLGLIINCPPSFHDEFYCKLQQDCLMMSRVNYFFVQLDL